jgi:hypothetical protein
LGRVAEQLLCRLGGVAKSGGGLVSVHPRIGGYTGGRDPISRVAVRRTLAKSATARGNEMNRSMVVIISAAVFSLIGLGAGYLAIANMSHTGPSRDSFVMVLILGPTVFGAFLGFAIGMVAAFWTPADPPA